MSFLTDTVSLLGCICNGTEAFALAETVVNTEGNAVGITIDGTFGVGKGFIEGRPSVSREVLIIPVSLVLFGLASIALGGY